MNDLLQFLTSSEAIIVYIVAAFSCCLCFIIYLVERNNVKLRQRHNTKELNKLVSQVKEEAHIEDQPSYDVPIMQPIEDTNDTKLSEMLAETQVLRVVSEEPEFLEVPEEVVEEKRETVEMEPVDILKEAEEVEDELEYTSIEPDKETAQMELRKLTEELQKQEELEKEEVLDPITNYEAEQEENAIISLEELTKKSKEMYEANEVTQYADEGNEPISLDELEDRYGKEAATIVEPFEIDKVVPEEEVMEELKEVEVPKAVEEVHKFKSSPIISPVYGIEKTADENRDIELENTANYDKLDAEIKKTNEFLMTLKDLQQKVD